MCRVGGPLGIKGLPQHESKLWSVRTCFSCLDLACAASSKSKTRLRVKVVNDQVSLYVETPTTRVSSAGKNTLGAAYDPNSGRSYLAAYQNQMRVMPRICNQVPFTLGSVQQVEINSNGVGPITTVGQTSGGSAYVSPMERIPTAQLGKHGGCYTDPTTGEIVCVERISDFSNPMSRESEGSNIVQSGTSAIPYCLQECETYTSEICGTWTLQGSHINALWNNGSKAAPNFVQFDNKAVVITREGYGRTSTGLTARYEGRPIGDHVESSAAWNWKEATFVEHGKPTSTWSSYRNPEPPELQWQSFESTIQG